MSIRLWVKTHRKVEERPKEFEQLHQKSPGSTRISITDNETWIHAKARTKNKKHLKRWQKWFFFYTSFPSCHVMNQIRDHHRCLPWVKITRLDV